MEPSQKLEMRLGACVLLLLCFFLTLTIIAVKKFGIDLPGCVTNVSAFSSGSIIERAPGHFEIHYVARMWSFEPANIELPTGAEADIYLNSVDVTHGFQILGTNVNLMAVPGAVNYSHVKFPRAGKFPVVCHEYCGAGHQTMETLITVSDHPNQRVSEILVPPALSAEAQSGSKLVTAKGCVACHSLDPSQATLAPSFKGLWGKQETMSDGTKIQVDENYVIESVLHPQAKLVKGYGPVMPALPVSSDELKSIIEYLKTLK